MNRTVFATRWLRLLGLTLLVLLACLPAAVVGAQDEDCLLYTSPSPRD